MWGSSTAAVSAAFPAGAKERIAELLRAELSAAALVPRHLTWRREELFPDARSRRMDLCSAGDIRGARTNLPMAAEGRRGVPSAHAI